MGLLAAGLVAWPVGLPAATSETSFQFQEVYDLLKANLAGTTESELSQAAVLGLIDQLGGRVTIVGEAPRSSATGTNGSPVSASVFDTHFGYLRLPELTPETARQFDTALSGLRATNKVKGLILDLRFSGGQDYAAAVALADRFMAGDESMVDWGEGWKKSSAKTNAIALPLTILVNRKTSGAAEVLAGILRHRDLGLLIGTNTAGQASMAREFALKTGQRLRVAVAPVKVADGRELPFTGMKADIEIEVSPEDERAWYDDVFKPVPKPPRTTGVSTNDSSASGTNRAARRRLNEAELVRLTREGQNPERDLLTNTPARPSESGTPTIADPTLARALDLLKGLAVVQQFRSS
ncbi:MAG TPA: S41 family peptidase [Candidatus Dormibacteraeota bacterium]|nr:S41 family peptidase [Candidatus Dormibacteraeota bacterium]